MSHANLILVISRSSLAYLTMRIKEVYFVECPIKCIGAVARSLAIDP